MHQQETQKVETKWETNKTNFGKEVGKVNPENWIGCKKEYDDLS